MAARRTRTGRQRDAGFVTLSPAKPHQLRGLPRAADGHPGEPRRGDARRPPALREQDRTDRRRPPWARRLSPPHPADPRPPLRQVPQRGQPRRHHLLHGRRAGRPAHGRGASSRPVELVQQFEEVIDGRNAHGNRAPRQIGSAASKLMTRITTAATTRVKVSPQEATRSASGSTPAPVSTRYLRDHGRRRGSPASSTCGEMKRYSLLPPDFNPKTTSIDSTRWTRPISAPSGTSQKGHATD